MNKRPRLMHLDEKVLHVPFEVYEERNNICKKCYAFQETDSKCKIIGEPITARSRMKSGSCPMGFWSSYYGS